MKLAFAAFGIALLLLIVLIGLYWLGSFLFGTIGIIIACVIWLLLVVVGVGLYIDHNDK